jgi:Lon protease-like protein
MTDNVALFPIPDLVAFPGTIVPLHVFEPRYRQMVDDAVEQQRMIGVSNTRKEIHPGRKHETVEQALASNQATYQPFDIFTAGHVEVVNRTEDGRIHAVIHAARRMQRVGEVQTLPYRIVEAVEVADEEEDADTTAQNRALQTAINQRLIDLVSGENEALAKAMAEIDWDNQSPAEFSFKVFQFLRFEPDLMQMILESRRPSERLKVIDDMLVQASGG